MSTVRVIAWDIGIRTLSFCALEYQFANKTFTILEWGLIDTLNEYLKTREEFECKQKIEKITAKNFSILKCFI